MWKNLAKRADSRELNLKFSFRDYIMFINFPWFWVFVDLFSSYKYISPSFLCFPLFLSHSQSLSTAYLFLTSFRKQSDCSPDLVPLNSTIIRSYICERVFEKPQTVLGRQTHTYTCRLRKWHDPLWIDITIWMTLKV